MTSEAKHDGERLTDILRVLLASQDAPPVWIDADNLKAMKDLRSVLVVGPSNSGKTTMVNMMRKVADGIFEVPKRVLTRPPRLNDDLGENRFVVSHEEFKKLTAGGIAWNRDMGDGRTEWYGFPPASIGKVPIYSASSSILEPKAEVISADPDFFDHTLIIFVNAPIDVLEKRMEERSPDLFKDHPKEVKMRLHEIFVSPKTHIIVDHSDNSFETLERCAKMIVGAIEELKTGKS